MNNANGTKICKACSMSIPKAAAVCPHCRKRQGISLIVKFFIGVFVFAALISTIANHSDNAPATTAPGPDSKQQSLEYNSKCIRHHLDRYNYIPSTAQTAELNAAKGDPQRVLNLLTGYVKASLDDFESGVKNGISDPSIRGMSESDKQSLVRNFRKRVNECAALLKELKSIEITGPEAPGMHGVKGKTHPCPHDVDGRLEVAKFKSLK